MTYRAISLQALRTARADAEDEIGAAVTKALDRFKLATGDYPASVSIYVDMTKCFMCVSDPGASHSVFRVATRVDLQPL